MSQARRHSCRSALVAPMGCTVEPTAMGDVGETVCRNNLGAAEWPVLSVPWGKTRRGRDRESR